MFITGKIIDDYRKGTIMEISSKLGRLDFEEYRTLNHNSHVSNRKRRYGQFNFKQNIETNETTFALRTMLEKLITRDKETFIFFVDRENFFRNIQWNELFKILKIIGIK